MLIVSPHFPPTNAPDMQRIRTSLPDFVRFGWEPIVLAVRPEAGQVLEPLLSETVPQAVRVEWVRPLPRLVTNLVRVRNSTIRALPALYAKGARLIKTESIDLVYFSTSMFFCMPLGRIWRRQFGVPVRSGLSRPLA